MDLKFSLEEMKSLYEEMNKNYENYNKSLEELDKEIEHLSTIWISNETNTYEAFKDKYNEKKKELIEARDLIKSFCIKLNETIESYNDSSISVINSFM